MSTHLQKTSRFALAAGWLLCLMLVPTTTLADEPTPFTSAGYSCPRNCPCPGDESMLAEGQLPPSYSDLAGDLSPQAFGGLGSGMWNVNDSPGGYIDNPIVGTWWRIRYDDANDGSRPDRAAFFYAPYFGSALPVPQNGNVVPSRVDYQLISTYAEILLFPRLSGFVELASLKNFLSNDTNVLTNHGLGDTIAGVKYLLYSDEERYLTFQLKAYIPTGDARLLLGTGHVSLEPGLLYLRRISDRSYFQGELRYWIPISGPVLNVFTGDPNNVGPTTQIHFSGSVVRYGAGIGYDLYQGYSATSPLNPYVSNGGLRLTAVGEIVGWTITGGDYTKPVDYTLIDFASSYASAAGNTIVNMKLGLRGTVGPRSLYVGWGHALTGAPFYEDLLRIEYRRMF